MDGASVYIHHTFAHFVEYKLIVKIIIDESNSDKNFGFKYYCFVSCSQKDL